MTLLSWLIENTFEFSLLALASLGTAATLRRRSAAARHWILTAAVAAALAAPALGLLVPSWQLPINRLTPAPGLSSSGPGSGAFEARGEDVRVTSERAEPAPTTVFMAVALAWAAGAGVHAAALLAGLLRLRRVRRQARVNASERWGRVAAEMSRRYGLRRDVLLLQSDHPSLLVTWGFMRPKVILPLGADRWSEDRARVVLAHELAHVQRADWVVQIAAEVLRAIYWFNPLSWILCRRLRHESERAADDAVLNGGIDGNDYASHLLDVARAVRARHRVWWPAAAIVGRSTLERRITAMLNTRLDRAPLPRSARLGSAAAILALAAAIASAQGALATYSGAILDPMNRTVPNVTLVLTNLKTNAKHQVRSDETGRFEVASLPPGEYALEVKAPGFMAVRGQVAMTGQNVQQSVNLTIGTLEETIRVKAGAVEGENRPAPRPAQSARPTADCTPSPHGGNIRPPRKLLDVRPIYPVHLANAGTGGKVLMHAVIAKDGTVKDVRVVNAAHPDLDAAAVTAVRQWQFDSTLLNCMPTEVTMKVNVTFEAE